MSEIKNSPDGVNNRLDFAEGIEDSARNYPK